MTTSAPATETVVVVGHSGPALWHATRGNSEVWILGSVAPMPQDMQWDSRDIGMLLQGARVLLLPPRAEMGLLEGLWFAVSDIGSLEQPDGMTLENSLDRPLRERFIAARTRAHRDASRYAKYLPAIAALRIEMDSRAPAGLTMTEPEQAIEMLASRAGVPACR